jgi:hypothetical protein
MSSISNGDVRKDYVLSTIANYFGVAPQSTAITGLVKSDKLNNFLDDGNAMLLAANVEVLPEGVKVHLDNATHVGQADNKAR